jgi:glutamate N-acetyltransferase/amino-acid N-acetyltransferase
MASDPVLWCRSNLRFSKIPFLSNSLNKSLCKVLIVNSGCSNTYTGENGIKIIKSAVDAACEKFKCKPCEVFVSSTGVIGQYFSPDLIANAITNNFTNLKPLQNSDDFLKIIKAIETTDTFSKVYSQTTKIAGIDVKITGIIKGSGMIEPNMATMLGYIFCDANVSSSVMQSLLNDYKDETFNSITVDSDTSTSDTILAFATKTAKHKYISLASSSLLNDFRIAFKNVMLNLSKLVVMDGEGVSKFITINVTSAINNKQAKKIAKSIANSPLVKTAIAGGDANWGRIAMAIGKTLENINRNKISINFGDFNVAKNWQKLDYSESAITEYLRSNQFIDISVDLGIGFESAKVYTCDLTHEYISINGDYRS